jgi:small-conductance mechanosensitive channel
MMTSLPSATRVRTLLAAFTLFLAAACLPARAAEAPAGSAVPELPQTLTRESVRDLMSRLSDREVRALLIEQLDRATGAPAGPSAAAATAPAGMAGMAGVAGMVEANAGTIRTHARALYAAFLALPETLPLVVVQLADAAGDDQLWPLAGYFAAMVVLGAGAEVAYTWALRRYRRRLRHAPVDTFSARAFQLGIGLFLDAGGIAVFALGALVVVFARWLPNEVQRIAVLVALLAVVIVRVAALLARLLLDGGEGRSRLLPLTDAPARSLRRFVIALAVLYALGVGTTTLLTVTGVDAIQVDLLRILFWSLGLALSVAIAWHVRAPIADLIRGDRSHGSVVGWLADFWPVGATLYCAALLAGGMSAILAGMPGPIGTGVASIVVVIALPIADMALCRTLAAAANAASGGRSSAGVPAVYEPIFRRAIHIVVVVLGLLVIASVWHLDLFAIAQRSLGGRIASSLLGISIVLLAAYMVWQIACATIDRRLAAEGEQEDDVPATRLRTLLPILRATVLVVVVVMAGMSILAALGVDILPLLAGASVVGVAIGFGSQTLVRDIVSGAFFLMDDAFRLGEYIEVGDAKGRVEKINLRSVFLRHHRGALNIVPYGEIKRLRNTDRDWSIHVLEFRLTYDTNMVQVKKILKDIGDELAADPDYANDILKPLKSAGVIAAEDSAIVVRGKFTVRPGNNAWVIRRVAYDKIIRAFRERGIRFAHRQVTVNVPSAGDAELAASAAAAIESQAARTIDKASQT